MTRIIILIAVVTVYVFVIERALWWSLVLAFEAAERRISVLIFGNDYELKDRRRLRNCPSRH